MAGREPTDEEWGHQFERLDEALEPLFDAGWQWLDDEGSEGYADEGGIYLDGILHRTGMLVAAAYESWGARLTLGPTSDFRDFDEFEFDMLTDEIVVDLGPPAWLETLRTAVARAWLLDPTRIDVGPADPEGTAKLWQRLYIEYLLVPAARRRHIAAGKLLDELESHRAYTNLITMLCMSGGAVAIPDPVPNAASLGIAVWCWRNTAVEQWHSAMDTLPDVVMAKLNIAATRSIREHVSIEEIDWDAISTALTDGSLALPDGRRVDEMFGKKAWHAARASIEEQIGEWRSIDDLLGPASMVRFASMLGSTSYTSQWWGNGWWPDLCRRIVTGLVDAEVPLPAPYDQAGAESLIAVLTTEPDGLADDVLEFCIDPPRRADGTFTDGIRFSRDTAPRVVHIGAYPVR